MSRPWWIDARIIGISEKNGLAGLFVLAVDIVKKMGTYKFTIPLRPKQKKNSRPILRNRKTGKPFLGKDESLRRYEAEGVMILTPQKNIQGIKEPLAMALRAHYIFEYISECPADGDNLQVAANDLLQRAKIIKNDKQIKVWAGCVKEHTGRARTIVKLRPLGPAKPKVIKESKPAVRKDAISFLQSILKG